MKHALLLIGLFCLLAPATPALAVQGVIAEVNNCESIIVIDGAGKAVNARLFGVVCPRPGGGETGPQPYGDQAVEFLRALLPKDLAVVIHDMRRDAMGRERGHTVTLPGGALVQSVLLGEGLAWVSPTHCGACRDWKKLEERARQTGKGLWRDEAPVPPWEWTGQK